MSDHRSPSPEAVDEYLHVLANEQCRAVVAYFARRSTETATIDDLAAFVRDQTRQDDDAERIRIRLHHVTLPRLAEYGVIEYDPRSNTARYRGRPTLETWVNRVVELGEIPDVPA